MDLSTLVETAPAKINLTLAVLGRRPDKYHLIDSLVVFTDVGDELSLIEGEDFSLEVTGNFASSIKGDNLVSQVAQALMQDLPDVKLGCLQLQKNIPVAAGIGGGSADVAAFLRLVRRSLADKIDQSYLNALGARFGADIPVCMESVPAFISGIGEIVEPVHRFPEIGVLLVNPGVHVITSEVFCRFELPLVGTNKIAQKRPQFHSIDDVVGFMQQGGNDLTAAATKVCPQISQVLSKLGALPDCHIARLSGSGATCFGLFETRDAALKASKSFKGEHPDWLVAPACIPGCG